MCARAYTRANTRKHTTYARARTRARAHTQTHTHTQVHDDMSASLVLVDAAKNTDKYYILQLLAHKKQPATFYVFNRWGVYIILIAGVCAYINRCMYIF